MLNIEQEVLKQVIKLAKERENLVRVNDIIATLETQVGPLEVQAEKAKKFNINFLTN